MTHAAYYNELDPYAAKWLRNLVAAGHIAPGDVDERSIRDVAPSDLIGYTQCHFFAGIGVWSHALRSAGWDDARPVWTGSCRCQPFSAAGKQEGTADPRHLWPSWFGLVREHRPVAILGEQVGAAIRHGWLDLVQADLEGLGYAVGAAVVGAHSVGAPHIRQRLFFVADAGSSRHEGNGPEAVHGERDSSGPLAGADGRRANGRLGHPESGGRPRQRVHADGEQAVGNSQATAGFWNPCDWLPCIDGKARPVEPGTFPLAHGVAGRVGRLRAYGNAIVAPVAAEFIRAYIECRP